MLQFFVAALEKIEEQDAVIGRLTSTGQPMTVADLSAGLRADEPWALAHLELLLTIAVRHQAVAMRRKQKEASDG